MTTHKSLRDVKVDAYLVELEWALATSDPRERAETLASIREHLDLSLPLDATPEQVDAVLANLGPADSIAKTVTPGSAANPDSTPRSGDSTNLGASTDSTAVLLLGGSILALLLFLPLFPVAIALAVITLIGGIKKMRSKEGNIAFAKAAVILSILALIGALMVAMGLAAGLAMWSTVDEGVVVVN